MSRLIVSLAALALLLPASSSAQDITRGPDGTVSIRASGVPLERVLQALGEISPFEKIVMKDGVGGRLVTVTLDNVTVLRAIIQALNIAEVDYVLGGARLVVGDSNFAGAAVPADVRNLRQPGAVDTESGERTRKRAEADAADAAPEESQAAETAQDAAEARIREAELERALAPPALPIPPGAAVDLPFPGPDGRTPVSVIKQANPPSRALPFPGAGTPRSPAPRSSDPRAQELIDALTPKRPPGK